MTFGIGSCNLWKFRIRSTLIPQLSDSTARTNERESDPLGCGTLALFLSSNLQDLVQCLVHNVRSRKICWFKELNEWFITHTMSYDDFSACLCIWRSLETESIFLFSVPPYVLPIGDTQCVCHDSINKWGCWPVYISISIPLSLSLSLSISIYLQSNWLFVLSLTLVFLNHPSFSYSLNVSSGWLTHYSDICWVKNCTEVDHPKFKAVSTCFPEYPFKRLWGLHIQVQLVPMF